MRITAQLEKELKKWYHKRINPPLPKNKKPIRPSVTSSTNALRTSKQCIIIKRMIGKCARSLRSKNSTVNETKSAKPSKKPGTCRHADMPTKSTSLTDDDIKNQKNLL